MNLTPKTNFSRVFVAQMMLINFISRTSRPASLRMVAQAFSTQSSRYHGLARRFFHSSPWALNSAVEEDLDSALDSILGDAFQVSETPAATVVAPAPAPVRSCLLLVCQNSTDVSASASHEPSLIPFFPLILVVVLLCLGCLSNSYTLPFQ